MINIKPALDEMMKLNSIEVAFVIIELLNKNKLSFTDLTQLYVNDLKEREKMLSDQIMPLAMHLGLATQGNLDIKAARQLIYKAQYFKDAPFGKELEEEFKNENI